MKISYKVPKIFMCLTYLNIFFTFISIWTSREMARLWFKETPEQNIPINHYLFILLYSQ